LTHIGTGNILSDQSDASLFRFTTIEANAAISIDFKKYIDSAIFRAKKVDSVMKAVSVADDVMNGMPVFQGTRVPIDTVLASLEGGVNFRRLKDSYPFLTEELIEIAKIYARIRPRRGRPRHIAEDNPGWKVKSSKVVRAASK
jgi:uncharacterized protein (DUF433 family)